MNAIEFLRFDWRPTQVRLLLAALADAGPVVERVWAVRSGVPGNHIKDVIRECTRLGGLAAEARAEGIALFVQPAEFWRVTPLADAAAWSRAWGRSAASHDGGAATPPYQQSRMALVTEAPTLGQVLAQSAPSYRIPVNSPDSGGFSTYRRSDVSEIKRITSKRGGAAAPPYQDGGAAATALPERVKAFVGERDWRRYWEHEEAQAIFEDADRAEVLANSLGYCQASLRDGVQVRKNTGAMLWEDYKRSLGRRLAKV